MSRREDNRSSDTKRHRSRIDREPSPKRSKRDGKPETERQLVETDDRLDRDIKNRRPRLQEALPLEGNESKVEMKTVGKESEDKDKDHKGGSKRSEDPNKVPRSTTYFQHDDRGSAGQNGRSFSRRTEKDHGLWRDHNKQQNDRIDNTTEARDTHRKDERRKDSRDVWRHDGYFEMGAHPKPTERKRPAFREEKINTTDTEKTNKSVNLVTPKPQDCAVDNGRRRERPFSGAREFNKADGHRRPFSSFDRNNAGDRYRGRDGVGAGRGSRQSGGAVEKWKHDMYDEANRSPTPKNEEDQISKIEALLAK